MASVTWTGLDTLLADLRRLPAALAGEGADIVERHATAAFAAIEAGYPERSGDLRRKLTVKHTRSPFGAASTVRNTAKYALTFEIGSQVNRVTKQGWNRGKMPPNPIFSRAVLRERRAMYDGHRDLLQRAGLSVSGEP